MLCVTLFHLIERISACCRTGCHSRAAAVQRPFPRNASSSQPAWYAFLMHFKVIMPSSCRVLSCATGCYIELTYLCQPAFTTCIKTLQAYAHHPLLLDVIVASHCFLASTAIDRRPSPSPVSLQQQQQVQQQQAQQQQQQLLNQLAGYQEGTCAHCSLSPSLCHRLQPTASARLANILFLFVDVIKPVSVG